MIVAILCTAAFVLSAQSFGLTEEDHFGGGHQVQPKKPTTKGPAEWFTGDVWMDTIAQAHGPSPMSIGSVHFAPGARTAWDSHSIGQTL
jgi:hypothetical protein